MISAFGSRHDDIGIGRFAQKKCEKRRRHERHVAGKHQQPVVAGGRERRIEAAERPRVSHTVGYDADTGVGRSGRLSGYQQNVVGQPREFGDLTLENRTPLNFECTFVASAEPGGSAPGKNRRAGHDLSILLCH
jgi:hypothetical protein